MPARAPMRHSGFAVPVRRIKTISIYKLVYEAFLSLVNGNFRHATGSERYRIRPGSPLEWRWKPS